MLALPTGWTVRRMQPAIELVCDAGRIVIDEGIRPFDRARMFEELACSAHVEYLVTHEGELAALARSESSVVGFVFLDDSYVCAVGTGDMAEVERCMRELVPAMKFYCGSSRRRWFRYQPPAGWRRVEAANGDETWLAPSYPAERLSLTVPWALPSYARAEASLVRTLLGMAEVAGEPSQMPLVLGRLTGYRWERVVESMVVVVAAVTDERYDYYVRSIAPVGTKLDAFDHVLASIEPIPVVATKSSDVMAFWCG